MWDRQPSPQLTVALGGTIGGSASKKIAGPEVALITGMGQSCVLGKLRKLTSLHSFSFVSKIQVAQHQVSGDSWVTAWVSGDTEGIRVSESGKGREEQGRKERGML